MSDERDKVGKLAEDYERKRQHLHNVSVQNVYGMTEEERVASAKAYHQAVFDLNEARIALDKAKDPTNGR